MKKLVTTPAGSRVLILLENSHYPGDPRVRAEAGALTDAGYEVSVVCLKGPDRPWREVVDGVSVYRFPEPPPANGMVSYLWEYGFSMVAMFLMSLLVLLREGFDIVHAANPPDT